MKPRSSGTYGHPLGLQTSGCHLAPRGSLRLRRRDPLGARWHPLVWRPAGWPYIPFLLGSIHELCHYLSQTDVTALSWMVCKSPYTPLGMKIMNNDSQVYILNFSVFVTVIPAISNDNTLALTCSIEFTCPHVSGSTSGKTLGGFAPLGFPLGWSLHTWP